MATFKKVKEILKKSCRPSGGSLRCMVGRYSKFQQKIVFKKRHPMRKMAKSYLEDIFKKASFLITSQYPLI